jgi:putative SOS response-associated peptidase YedK
VPCRDASARWLTTSRGHRARSAVPTCGLRYSPVSQSSYTRPVCGRFALFAMPEDLARHFGASIEDVALPARYNAAPTQTVPVVRTTDGGQQLIPMHWGLIPAWAKDPSIGNRIINARAETVAERPAFRSALKTRRCLVPASGFYEWHARGRAKQAHFTRRADGRLLAFAGLWERWQPAEGPAVESCAILTTPPNAVMAPIHNRMPVILAPENFATWLGEGRAAPDQLTALLRPCADDLLAAYPVSTYVNAPAHDGPEAVAPRP